MNDDERPSLEAILCYPDSDAERLVFADWLEEHGQVERAEFIRVQCQLAADPHEPALCNVTGICARCSRTLELRRRERELLDRNEGAWLGWLKEAWGAEWVPVRECGLKWRRGFIESVSCTAADWLQHGRQIVRCQPIREVRLTGIYPSRSQFAEAPTVPSEQQGLPFWSWSPPMQGNGWSSDQVPWEIYPLLDGACNQYHKQYLSEAAAWEALSRAALLWARQEPCLACEGRGLQILRRSYRCPECQGRGWVDFRTLLVRAGGKDSGSRPTPASPELPSSE